MDEPGLGLLQQRIDRSPFNAWLGIRLLAGGEGRAELCVSWRDTFISTPERKALHGGVLASLVDVGAIFAVICTTGQLQTTVDLRVDYHGRAEPGTVRIAGRAIRIGKTLSTSEAQIFDVRDRLVASGRGTFLSLDKSALDLPPERVDCSTYKPQ